MFNANAAWMPFSNQASVARGHQRLFSPASIGNQRRLNRRLHKLRAALTPVWWYLAVVNLDATNVQYSVRATEVRVSAIRSLTNCLPITNRIVPLGGLLWFTISSNALEALFDLACADRTSLEITSGPGNAAQQQRFLLRGHEHHQPR